jgi:hypothetical protein
VEYRVDGSIFWDSINISTPKLIVTNTNIINVVGGQRRMLFLKES